MKTSLFALLAATLISIVSATEEMTTELKARHGGIIKKASKVYLEVVQDKDHTSIYITGHDHKNITDQKLSLSAIAEVNGKKYPMQLSFENDHYSARPANSYLHKENNYVLKLNISFSGTVDRVNFNLKNK